MCTAWPCRQGQKRCEADPLGNVALTISLARAGDALLFYSLGPSMVALRAAPRLICHRQYRLAAEARPRQPACWLSCAERGQVERHKMDARGRVLSGGGRSAQGVQGLQRELQGMGGAGRGALPGMFRRRALRLLLILRPVRTEPSIYDRDGQPGRLYQVMQGVSGIG